MKLSFGVLACLTIAFSLGCNESDAEKFADGFCAEIAKCCIQARLPGDGKSCHALEALAAAGGQYDSQAGDACLAEVRSQVSAGTFCTDLVSSSKPSCDSVYGYGISPGSQRLGAPCTLDDDCASSSTTEVGCSMVTQTCTALLAVGATCRSPTDCVRSAFCDDSKTACTARVAAGGVCAGNNSMECVDGTHCSSSSNQCTAKVAIGAACTTSAMCKYDCSGGTCQNNGRLIFLCTATLDGTP